MATEEKFAPVRYWPKDETVSLDGKWENHFNLQKQQQQQQQKQQQQQQQKDSARCTPMTILKIALPIIMLMLIAVPVITAFVFRHIDRLSEYGHETIELPDVTNLKATDVGQDHFILSWTPLLSDFDYYLIESYDVGNVRDMLKPLRVGSCSYGTLIHRDLSEISCDNLKACANVSITVHTKVKRGTHDATSTGTKLEGILIPGREPGSPKNVKIIHASAKVTRIQWEPPSKVSGRIGHIVSICRTFTSCNEPGSVGNCTERETSEPWFDIQSSGNSKLCVLVRSTAECGAHVFRSHPVAAEITPPSYVLPDVDNLTLVDIGPDYFTVSWMHPVAQFEYYWLEVYKRDDGSDTLTPQRVGSCANGTIVHREQTQITCDMFKPCSNVTVTLHTQAKGTFELRSTGATLQGIFMHGKGIPEVMKLKQTAVTKNSVTVSWERPKGCFDEYVVTANADNTELGGQETSAGTCGNGTIVPANETSVKCDGIEASVVSIRVQTRRSKSDGLISQGVTLQGIATSKRVLPDVTNLSLIDVGPDSFTVSWVRPSFYFDYYWVEVYDISNGRKIPTPHRVGACAYGNIIHRDQTQITCDKFKACANASITVHVQSKGPSGLTSPGATLRGIFVPGRDLPEVTQLKLTDMDKDSITVSWKRPEGCFDGYIVEVTEENSGRSGVGGLSAGSCAGGTTVDAQQTSITCRKIEACSVKMTVRTQRKEPLELTSSGTTLHDIVMYKKDMPEVLPTIKVANDTFVLRWNRPTGCFDKYNLEVTYQPDKNSLFNKLRIGSCAGTTILEPDVTNVTCSNLPACVNTSVILRTQRNGPHGRVSSGEALSVYSKEGDLVDFDLYVDRMRENTAEIVVDPQLPRSCPPRYCGAGCCRFYKSGAVVQNCWGEECEARNSYSSEMVVKLKHLTPGGFHTCRVTLRYNDEVSKQIGINAVP